MEAIPPVLTRDVGVKYFRRIAGFIIRCTGIIFLLASGTGCRQQLNTGDRNLARLLQADTVRISLKIPLTVNVDGHDEKRLEEFIVNTSIAWYGNVFHASRFEAGSNTTIVAVHGNVTSDGAWVDSMAFDRVVLLNSKSQYIFFAGLRSIPLTVVEKGGVVGTFVQAGDIRKYVANLTYNPEDKSTYVSTDWQSASFPPVLRLDFSVAER